MVNHAIAQNDPNKRENFAEARQVYETLISKLDGTASKKEGELSQIVQFNRAIIESASTTIQKPLLDCMKDVHIGVEASREAAECLKDLPGPVQEELESIPTALKVDVLADDFTRNVYSVLNSVKEVVANPKLLYPRLLCGSIAVDPAKVTNLAKRYKAIEFLDGGGEGESMARAMKGPPKDTADAVSGISSSLSGVTDPLIAGIGKLKEIKDRLSETSKSIRSLSDDGVAFQNLLTQQENIGNFLEGAASSFHSPSQSPRADEGDIESRSLSNASVEVEKMNAMNIIEKGADIVKSADSFNEALDSCVEKVKEVGGKVSVFAEEMKELFSSALEWLGKVAELLRTFIVKLPMLIAELKSFFVPTGLRALIMQPSSDTRNLLGSIESLQVSVPNPDEIESTAREALVNSESASKLESIREKIASLIAVPQLLIRKLEKMSAELPGKLLDDTKRTAEIWIEEFGKTFVSDKIETGLEDAAAMVGCEKFASAVTNMLDFGKSSPSGQDELSKSNLDDSSALGNMANTAGNIFKSFF